MSPLRTPQSLGGTVAVGLHVLVLAALLAYEPARSALQAAAPVMVSLISPQRAEPKPEPPVEVPKPKPVVKPLPEKPVMLAAPTPAPAMMTAPPLPPEPPAPAVEPVAPPPAPVAAVPVQAITPPIYNADYLDNPAPVYPLAARRSGQQGRVVLRVLVNASGTADEVQIRESSGHLRLDEAARATVLNWRFVPAKRGDQPVPAWVLIPISFRLEG